MSLPNYMKQLLKSTTQTNSASEELLKLSTGQETWEEMIENPYLFYNRFSENMERLRHLSSSCGKKIKQIVEAIDSMLYKMEMKEKTINSTIMCLR